ncbi:hypothetical protein M422DRAFT_272534 [Sphaerobolus stellatus SS14]|uniref:Uncharacterized protein n=1 Tax=Sphaerobolus stellatus (strain SS14) TaxID=990650 RepID=A0A0C9TX65_SPHS4|nr:hypothetical protein M422DRAFT_272534 [Sphaerobolus stellatus SS14]
MMTVYPLPPSTLTSPHHGGLNTNSLPSSPVKTNPLLMQCMFDSHASESFNFSLLVACSLDGHSFPTLPPPNHPNQLQHSTLCHHNPYPTASAYPYQPCRSSTVDALTAEGWTMDW